MRRKKSLTKTITGAVKRELKLQKLLKHAIDIAMAMSSPSKKSSKKRRTSRTRK